MNRPIFRRKDQWILCMCRECYGLNYVEPHGTSAMCEWCERETEHASIPYKFRDLSGMRLVKRPGIGETLGIC
jgi:hypothetical protein